MNDIAERYVKLVLALGQHDADYVDAYYGPPEWKQEAERRKVPLDELAARAATLLDAIAPGAGRRRTRWTGCGTTISSGSCRALSARIRMLKGERLSFDEESRALYDAVAPTLPESHFQKILDQLEKHVPGHRSAGRALRRVSQRGSSSRATSSTRSSRRRFNGCRERTLQHVTLPESEQFTHRVRHQQVVERLQLVPGQLPQPDPGQHRSADLHRSRGRSRVPRGLSRSSRLQRAAREAPGARPRLDRVLRVSAVLAAVADRGRHGELRHRGRVSGPGARRVREDGRSSRRRPRPGAGRRVLPRAGTRRSAGVCRQRGGAAVSQRRDRSRRPRPPGSSATR